MKDLELVKLKKAVRGKSILLLFATCIYKPKDKNYMLPDWAIKHNKKLFRRYGHAKISYEELSFKLFKPMPRCILIGNNLLEGGK